MVSFRLAPVHQSLQRRRCGVEFCCSRAIGLLPTDGQLAAARREPSSPMNSETSSPMNYKTPLRLRWRTPTPHRRQAVSLMENMPCCRKAPLCIRLGPIWAAATGATETFSFSDLRSTASGALEKRWRPCSSRKTTSKDVRCTPTRCAAAFFSLAACPDLLLRRRTHWGSEIGPCFRKRRGTTDTELVLHVATLVLPVRVRGRPLRPANRLR